MPRNSDGSYSLPAGTLATTGKTILVSQHNPAFQDVGQAIGNSLDRNGSGGMRANLPMGGNRIVNMAPGVDPTDGATVSQLTVGTTVPVGAIMDFAGSTSPDGWLICAGQALSRAAYPELFEVLGTTFGAPSGTTFSLPDLRGRTTAGVDLDSGGLAGRLTGATMSPDGATIGASGGAQTHTLTQAQIPSHTHTVSGTTNTAGTHSHDNSFLTGSIAVGGSGGFARTVPLSATSEAGAHSHTVTGTAAATGGGQAHPNVQPTLLLNKIIKASSI